MKNILLIVIGAIILIGGGYYFLVMDNGEMYTRPPSEATPTVTPPTSATPGATTTQEVVVRDNEPTSIIGESAGGNKITAYHFGEGEKEVVFLGGIHGGYSFNTALLGFELVDWFTKNENKIPENIRVTVIPVLNPDGLEKVTGSADRFLAKDVNPAESIKVTGRFNQNNVDVNRNFDCKWEAVGTWQNQSVSGGDKPFSEPESQAVRSFISKTEPIAVITWYSAAGGVYASACEKETLAETRVLTKLFAEASGYTAHEEFDYYEITGDMVNWLAKQNIPAISVLLTNRTDTEFTKNLAGVEAVLKHYAQ